MDHELTRHELRQIRLKRFLRWMIALFALLVIYALLNGVLRRNLHVDRILSDTAVIGRIEDALSAGGVVTPEFEQVFTTPIPTQVEQVFHVAGDHVQPGTRILGLNRESIRLQRDRLSEELELLKNRKIQLELQLEKRVNELQAQLDIHSLQIDLYQTKLDRVARLQKMGAETEDALNEARLTLQIAQRQQHLLTSQVENEQRTLEADLREVDLKIRIQEKLIQDIERQIELAEIRTAKAGVVTWVLDDIGASLLGGEVVARVSDLSSYKVEARISDVHAARLRIGQKVRVRLKNLTLPGQIISVNPSVENGIASFIVELEDRQHQALRSNLRVDVDVITAFKDSVVRVANGPAFPGPGRHYAYVIEEGEARKHNIVIGATNLDHVEIISGIQPGERVIISDMDEYKSMQRIRIKQ